MSTSSVLVDRNKLAGRIAVDENRETVEKKAPVQKSKITIFLHAAYREIMDTIKSILIILAFLAAYKISGLYSWWMQLIANAIS